MNNHSYPEQFKSTVQKRHGKNGKHVCQHLGCRTLVLKKYCTKHRPHVAPVPTITIRSKQ